MYSTWIGLFIGLCLLTYVIYHAPALQSSGKLDQLARKGHFCNVLDTIPQTVAGKQLIFEIMSNTCEDGMPHTTNVETIRFPESLWKQRDTERFRKVLRHELIHLKQRQSPTSWRLLYKKWGYSILNNPPSGVPSSIVERVRYNPDIADAPWALWKDRYVSVACYKSTTQPKLRDTEIVIWDLQAGKQVETMPEDWPWNGLHQAEHPHEISAEMAADLEHASYVPTGFVEFLKMQV